MTSKNTSYFTDYHIHSTLSTPMNNYFSAVPIPICPFTFLNALKPLFFIIHSTPSPPPPLLLSSAASYFFLLSFFYTHKLILAYVYNIFFIYFFYLFIRIIPTPVTMGLAHINAKEREGRRAKKRKGSKQKGRKTQPHPG